MINVSEIYPGTLERDSSTNIIAQNRPHASFISHQVLTGLPPAFLPL
jgi:hypothetical protein